MNSPMNSGRFAGYGKSLVFFAVLMAIAQAASAQIYRWTDSTGKVIVSDTPPPSGKGKKIAKEAGSPAEAPAEGVEEPKAKVALDPEVEKKVREKERQNKAAEDERKKAVAEYCDAAKDRLAQLQSGERIALRDKAGERYFMSDEQRAADIAKVKSGMAEQKCP
ncbi:MAG TPA: DUF4124 domain-containing protein [Rhodocyclaceae bacterium]|nr:DUF4124 domain-containing protein [Rhodocyclaceae bacterium]